MQRHGYVDPQHGAFDGFLAADQQCAQATGDDRQEDVVDSCVGGMRDLIEHQGILPGFNSQIFLAPDDGVGVLGFTNGAKNAVVWLTAEMGRLLGDLIGAPDDVIRTDVPHHPEIWSDLCGWYKPIAQRTDTQVLGIVGAGAEVFVRRRRSCFEP